MIHRSLLDLLRCAWPPLLLGRPLLGVLWRARPPLLLLLVALLIRPGPPLLLRLVVLLIRPGTPLLLLLLVVGLTWPLLLLLRVLLLLRALAWAWPLLLLIVRPPLLCRVAVGGSAWALSQRPRWRGNALLFSPFRIDVRQRGKRSQRAESSTVGGFPGLGGGC